MSHFYCWLRLKWLRFRWLLFELTNCWALWDEAPNPLGSHYPTRDDLR